MSFRKRLTFSLFLLAISVVAVQFFFLYQVSYQSVFREIQRRLEATARSASLMVSYELHEKMQNPTQETSSDYEKAIAPLAALLVELPRIRYIYTMKRIGNAYYFVLDPTPPGDHDHDGIDDKSHIMQPYTDIDTPTRRLIDRVLGSGKSGTLDQVSTDRWGTFLSSFAPLRSPDGDVYAVVGVDLQVDELKKNLAGFRRGAALSLGFGLLAAMGLSLLLASYLKNLLGRFGKAIEDFSNERPSPLPDTHPSDEFNLVFKKFKNMQQLITEQKQKLRDQIRELEIQSETTKNTQAALVQSQKLAALGQLGAGLAHELNSPLAAMLEMSRQLLTETARDHPDYELFEQMQEACEHMVRVVKSIALFARNHASERGPIAVEEALTHALTLIGHRLRQECIQVHRQFMGKSPVILGNFARVQEVFLNLYVNACDAMEANPSEASKNLLIAVTIVDREGRHWVKVSIQDTGSGIPEKLIPEIFNPFFTTKAAGKGTGLGLSICYGIVKEHDGTIEVESKEGVGTAFHVLFPLHSERPSP